MRTESSINCKVDIDSQHLFGQPSGKLICLLRRMDCEQALCQLKLGKIYCMLFDN